VPVAALANIRCTLLITATTIHGQSAAFAGAGQHGQGDAAIRKEYGVPGGFVGEVLLVYARLKRQLEKLFLHGKCDLIPGGVLLKKHLREKTSFSSNIGVDKL